ncbi:MAG: hypothetical protein CMN60_21430 [Sphingobium sp.]|nr:hypothetical protein [Sphingobium sp.]MBS50195.1 hypothetical protein [Sphingobium sp.]|tara:strand:+ start:17723 stop:17986 length:264 start_codon:yes stop_codon:yes gene_type:complete
MYNVFMPMFVRYGLPAVYSIISALVVAFIVTGVLWCITPTATKVEFFTHYNDGHISYLFLFVCVYCMALIAEVLGYVGKLMVKVIKK